MIAISTNEKGLQLKQLTINGTEYIGMRLAGPEAWVSLGNTKDWDYKKNPYGPGTLGFEKSESEIEAMKDRFLIMPKKMSPEDIKKNVVPAYLIEKSGIYFKKDCCQEIPEPTEANRSKDMEHEIVYAELLKLFA